MGMFKKATAKTTVMTPISINGITVTNVEEAVSQINAQLSNINVGEDGSTTTVISKTYETGNYTVTNTLNSTQKIIKEVYSGDINRIRNIEYVANNEAGSGKIKKEIIIENGKTTTITYSYDAYGNLISKNSITV